MRHLAFIHCITKTNILLALQEGNEVVELLAKLLIQSMPAQHAGMHNQDQWLQWDPSHPKMKHGLNFLTVIQKSNLLSVKVREVVIPKKLLDLISSHR